MIFNGTRNGIRNTSTARIRSAAIMIFLRSKRSTKTPANNPTSRLGAAVAISMRPTLMAELVRRKTRIDAASEVSAVPMVEISCPVHNQRKLKFLKILKGEGCVAAGKVVTAIGFLLVVRMGFLRGWIDQFQCNGWAGAVKGL